MDQMFYETALAKSGVKKNTKPPVVHKLRGTNVFERGNRSKNETVAHLSRQRADRDNQRLVIFGTKDNARVAKNEHLEVRPSAKPVDWYIREALQDAINTEHISSILWLNPTICDGSLLVTSTDMRSLLAPISECGSTGRES